MRAVVLVLGDIGRSPRMQYHARALACNDVTVDFIGHAGTPATTDIEQHPRISIHRLPQEGSLPPAISRLQYYTKAVWRGISESCRLFFLLSRKLPAPDLILAQTPPPVPTLPIVWLVAKLRGARFVIDWHNFGDHLLALRLGDRSLLVRVVARLEHFMARRADTNLVVSKAMQRILLDEWRAKSVQVLYDRPGEQFAVPDDATQAAARAELFSRLNVESADNAALLISPTSWTADEDFDLLLEALQHYDNSAPLRSLVILLTGKGPKRSEYEAKMQSLRFSHVQIRTAWLEQAEYPRMLAAADMGLCLHRSASGVDLPMKVADFFGAGLPVAALDYGPCLKEMIEPGVNGILFSDADTLARQLLSCLCGPAADLSELRRTAGGMAAGSWSWQQGWEREARASLLPEGYYVK